jgi:hypothetical protein
LQIEGRKILVLGGYGLVGTAVCRELLTRRPREIQIHSLRLAEAERARHELAAEAGTTLLTVSEGDIFGLATPGTRRAELHAQLLPLDDADLPRFRLYQLLAESRPDAVIACVNTATGIAYRDLFRSAEEMLHLLDEPAAGPGGTGVDPGATERLLEALYMPRLIRHIQLMYRGLADAAVRVYVKVGTSGTGGMGLNVPYTHSEERPSRVLLSKSAIAGAQSMLLFLMGRTPGGPIIKEIKPAAAIAWKSIGFGPIHRRGQPIQRVDARPRPLGPAISSHDPQAARTLPETYESVFIDTGENGVFSLEEFVTVTAAEQMEFVTPEEIARFLVYEIEGGNTGRDIISALDGAVLGPTYRAGLLRQGAIEQMLELERVHGTHSVAFEMLGPPRNSKLLFEAHLLRLACGSMKAVRESTPEALRDALDRLVREQPEAANRVVAIGLPILLDSGELLRGPEILVPAGADQEPVTAEKLERWVRDGWVDLRLANCHRWIERCRAIHREVQAVPAGDTSSRVQRDSLFWHEDAAIQPGRLVGWILSTEEKGSRMKR